MNTIERVGAGFALGALLAAGCASSDGAGYLPDETVGTEEGAATPSSKKFGSWCQGGTYDIYPPDGGAWVAPTGTTLCTNFNTEMKKIATHAFTYDLKGAAKQNWESTLDSLSMEKVDLSFAYAHGGASSAKDADYGLWKDGISDWNARVLTSRMRLGEETSAQRGLSILATYSCATLVPDANLWARWGNAFRGGLRIALGSHGNVGFGSISDSIGKIFAQKLAAGWTLAESWRTALASTSSNNAVAVMATGDTAVECGSRRDSMTFDNFGSKGRLKDNDVKFYCWTTWDNQ